MSIEKVSRWYFGGLASAGAACITHPLDLLKVHMQTQKGKNVSLHEVTKLVIRNEGVMGLYNGISASLMRQLTYSTVRFGIYEVMKQNIKAPDEKHLPLHKSVLIAGSSGFLGGVVGSPADLVNVRMQNDMKVPHAQRRNYKHVLHGIYKVMTKEGVLSLWTGASTNCCRAALMTIGQLSFYDLSKQMLLSTHYFHENVITHITASLSAGAIATTLCQPVDVLKTRAMNAKPGEVRSFIGLVAATLKEGPQAFYKGYIPAFVRLAPHTILTFVFLEQLRMTFGVHHLRKL